MNRPLVGMTDLFGLELRKRRLVSAVLTDLARWYGYEQVEVPLVERATSFSEEVVGRSPWPEWDQRGCFYLSVPDYRGSYDSAPATTEALLIPEGTISVTRWLGRLLAEDPDFVIPLKLFYETPCFRNELVDGLGSPKPRQFTQLRPNSTPTSVNREPAGRVGAVLATVMRFRAVVIDRLLLAVSNTRSHAANSRCPDVDEVSPTLRTVELESAPATSRRNRRGRPRGGGRDRPPEHHAGMRSGRRPEWQVRRVTIQSPTPAPE